MSAIAIQNHIAIAHVYAPRVRTARPVGASAAATAAATVEVSTANASGRGLAVLSASLDATARVSNALAVADDRLTQIGDLLDGVSSHSTLNEVDQLAASAKFGG